MMRNTLLATGIGLALAGCAIPNDRANPDEVWLLNDRLTVMFSNGLKCRAEGVSAQPSGQFAGCPIAASYRVDLDRPSYIGTGWTEPYADITITLPDGRETAFQTPESRNWTAGDRIEDDDDDEDDG